MRGNKGKILKVHWAKQSNDGRQQLIDGGRLLNYYAVNPVDVNQARLSYIIYGCPSAQELAEQDESANATLPSGAPSWLAYDAVHRSVPIVGTLVVNTTIVPNTLVVLYADYAVRIIEGDNYDDRKIYRIAAAPVNDDGTANTAAYLRGPIKIVTNSLICAFLNNEGTPYFFRIAGRLAEAEQDIQSRGRPIAGNDLMLPGDVTNIPDRPDNRYSDIEVFRDRFVLTTNIGNAFPSDLYKQTTPNQVHFRLNDFVSAEFKPDGIVGMLAFNRTLYVFGTESIEYFYESDTSDSDEQFAPIRPDPSSRTEFGCLNKNTIARLEEVAIFVSSDRLVRSFGDRMRIISNEFISRKIEASNIDTMWATAYTEEGHKFYVLVLEREDGTDWELTDGDPIPVTDTATEEMGETSLEKSPNVATAIAVVYDFITGLWHERTTEFLNGRIVYHNHKNISYGEFGSLHKIIELGLNVKKPLMPMYREACAPVLYHDNLRMIMHYLELELEILQKNATDETVLISTQEGLDDWTPDRAINATQRRTRINVLGQFRRRRIRMRSYFSSGINVLRCTASIEPGFS